MLSQNSPSPIRFSPAPVQAPVCVRIQAKPTHSLPVLPNGLQAVRDPETGQVRVVYPARRSRV